MTAIPSKLPEWATAGGADIVEPAQAQKEDGWDANDRPPAGFENWKSKLYYQWLEWISDIQVKNWSEYLATTASGSDDIQGITYGNGKYVAVGNTSATDVQHSPDSKKWTARSVPSSETLWGVHFNGTQFVAVGNNGTIIYTPADDPTATWSQNDQGSANFYAVWYGNGYWVAVNADGDIYYTSDPSASWTLKTTPASVSNESLYAVTYVEDLGLWVVVGEQSAGFSGIITADTFPSATWDEQTNPLGSPYYDFEDVFWNGSVIVATGGAGAGRPCIRSANGTTWVDKTSAVPNVSSNSIYAAMADPFGHVLIALDWAIFLSTDDCDTWLEIDNPGAAHKGVMVSGFYSAEASAFVFAGSDDITVSIRL